jgi:hypothetical protein
MLAVVKKWQFFQLLPFNALYKNAYTRSKRMFNPYLNVSSGNVIKLSTE